MRKTEQGEKKYARGGQVRGERAKNGRERAVAPVYTASFKVNRSDELLEFLLRKCNTSRNNVKTLLSNGQILVNGSVVTQYNFALAKDDEVKISKHPVRGEGGNGTKNGGKTARGNVPQRPKYRTDMKIIYEDEEFIAVDKPVGLLSVESDKETECAFGYVMAYLQAQDKRLRPFVLHRIDKETSGVLVFAKDIKIHSMLRMKWNELVTKREYFAVAEGKFEQKSGQLVHYLKENKNNLVYATNDPSGQKAVTNFEVVKENENFSLLKVTIETGRKNQIRVQMNEIGHPIVGDDKYGFTKDPLGRLGLHASALEFTHPVSGETIAIRASVPQGFWKVLG